MTAIANQICDTFKYYTERFNAAVNAERQHIENNYNCFISNIGEEKLYAKIPIILGELIPLIKSPIGYLIGKAIAFSTAQWVPATVLKVKAYVPERFNSLSNLQKGLIGIALGCLSVIYVPAPIFYGTLSLSTGLYFSQPRQKPIQIVLGKIPV